ncbi:hypothetical protein SCACP_21140 [Sporomusa carbonis]|uniref:helix-turn-helix domain-containing protein n=1 Tax=Sporomusa carbonis TaxID=3076075 RepID=UPI003A675766
MAKTPSWSSSPLPERLREGRRIRGITQNELADQLDISKQAVSQYEIGSNSPKPEIFEKICKILDLPYGYFFKPMPYTSTTPIFFRKCKTATKRDFEIFEGKVGWVREIYHYLQQFIEFPEVKILTKVSEKYSFEDVQLAAAELRKYWGLGLGPISNMTLLLENNGFVVAKVNVGAKKVDACSVLATGVNIKRPIIFLTPDTSAVRSRRDAAHELAHHVLHSWVDKEYFEANRERMDEEAEWFASSFLMPAESIRREAFSVSSLESIILLKKRWKVSAQSLLHYMYQLGVMNDNQFSYLRNKMYTRGWRRAEPLDDEIEQEEPLMLKQACELIIENNIKSRNQFIDDISFPRQDIEALCNLERNYLLETGVPKLKIVK